MKRITFETNNSIGHIELPDDAKNIKLSGAVCQNCEETEPLMPVQYPDEEEKTQLDNEHHITIPGGEDIDDEKPLLPTT